MAACWRITGSSIFEEPCPYWEIDWTREVKEALDLDVTGGEQDNYLPVWRYIIATGAVDVVQPDVCYVGGLTRALAVAELAEQAGLLCTPHSANLSLVTVFTLPHDGRNFECRTLCRVFDRTREEYYPWQTGLFSPALVARDGKVQIPEGPGWGVEISPDWLAAADYQISELD